MSAAVSQSAVLVKRGHSGLLHTGDVQNDDEPSFGVRVDTSKTLPAALLVSSSKFPFHTEGQESLFGTQSVINIPLFPTPAKGVSASQSLSVYACTQASLWKLLCKQSMLLPAPRGSLQTGT